MICLAKNKFPMEGGGREMDSNPPTLTPLVKGLWKSCFIFDLSILQVFLSTLLHTVRGINFCSDHGK